MMIRQVDHLFKYLLAIYVLFREGKKSIQTICHFLITSLFVVVLSYRSSLYISDTNLLSNMWFTSIFSHFIGCLFILFIVLFAVKNFSLMQSHFCVFALKRAHDFESHPKKIFAKSNIKEVFPQVFLYTLYSFKFSIKF